MDGSFGEGGARVTPVSAYIPCCNNADTVADTVRSIQSQTVPVAEIFVVDDASSDGSADAAAAAGAEVIRCKKNIGRGAVRAMAMEKAANALVLCCDANKCLAQDFLEKALPHFDEGRCAAVTGKLILTSVTTRAGRWQNRHLIRGRRAEMGEEKRRETFVTWGAVVKREAVMNAGNYDPAMRHSEDLELGERLFGKGYDCVVEPEAKLFTPECRTVPEALEKYRRWHRGEAPQGGWKWYARQIVYAVKVLVPRDLAEGDPAGAAISLFSPHYILWMDLRKKRSPE